LQKISEKRMGDFFDSHCTLMYHLQRYYYRYNITLGSADTFTIIRSRSEIDSFSCD